MSHAYVRAPLAQSVERWTFTPTVKASSPLWGEKYPFFKKLEAAKHKNSQMTNVTQKESRRAAKVRESKKLARSFKLKTGNNVTCRCSKATSSVNGALVF